MKVYPIWLLFLFCFAVSNAQNKYEKGYYITNSGERVLGFINNEGWSQNAEQFQFKDSENGQPRQLEINEVAEFGADKSFKYVRKTVAIDRASDDSNNLSSNRAPTLHEETLFLQVLIEGDANLYLFRDNNLQRFFYSTLKLPIEQLIYKRYKADNTIFGKNEEFKQQLLNNLKCESINAGMINKLEYAQTDLVKLFKKFNKCRDAILAEYEYEPQADFNLTIRPSLRIASFSFKNAAIKSKNADFDTQIGIALGVELEYIIPFERNTWALILEPTYQSYNPDPSITQGGQVVEVKYSSIEIPLGLRHYILLDEKSKLFVNAAFLVDLVLDSQFTFEMGDDLDVVSGSSIVVGFGYKFNNTYSAELRYQTDRSLTVDYNAYNSKYGSIGILFGYTIF